MATGPTPDGQRSKIDEFLASVDLSDRRLMPLEPLAPPCPHGMGTAKACVECMNEVGLGARPRKTGGPVRRWQDELPEATVAMLADFGADIVRTGQNTVDSANDYRAYAAQALVRLAEGTAWADLDTNVKSGCRSFMRWAQTARPRSPARQAALDTARRVFETANAR